MANERVAQLREALTGANVGWLLEEYATERLTQIILEIDELSSLLSTKLAQPCDVFAEMRAQATALKPLIQLFATPTTTAMRGAAYCIIRGMDVKNVQLTYELKRSVALSVTVEHVVTGEAYTFSSSKIWDVELLRHMGIMTLSGKPVLTGFYAFLD